MFEFRSEDVYTYLLQTLNLKLKTLYKNAFKFQSRSNVLDFIKLKFLKAMHL